MSKDEQNLVKQAIEFVAEGNTQEAIACLIEALNNDDWSIRSYAAQILGEIGKVSLDEKLFRKIIDRMLKAIKIEKDGWVREAFTKSFGKLGQNHPEVIQELLPPLLSVLMEDDHDGARGSAVKAIGDLGRIRPEHVEKSLPDLAEKLESDESWLVRYYSAYALGEIGKTIPEKIETYLETLTRVNENDVDNGVQDAARDALEKIKTALNQ
ncbi:MAG: HEAT repeat domain-containing protein [Candidatus Helarchaeota archaeon]